MGNQATDEALPLLDAEAIQAPVGLWKILGYTPHVGQTDAHRKIQFPPPDGCPVRYYAVECSRRWGTTTMAEVLVWTGLVQPEDFFGPPKVFVGADTYEHANKIWDRFERHLYRTPLRNLLAKHDRERELVVLHSGATVQKFSGDRPQSLTGEGYTLGIIDEAPFFTDEAMSQLFPAFTDRGATVIAFGTAEEDNWFATWGERGDDPDFPEYKHLRYPWWTNPLVDPRYIEIARRDFAREVFEARFEAKRPEQGGYRFTNIENCRTSEILLSPGFEPLVIAPPQDGHQYVAGLDLASKQDFSVLTIADADSGRLVYFHRLPHGPYKVQARHIARAVADYSARVLVDSTGVGASVVEDLREALDLVYQERWETLHTLPSRRAHFEEQPFTRPEKIELEGKLALLLEEEGIRFPNIDVLIRELKKYRGVLMSKPSDEVRTHDDCVSSLMLLAKILPRQPRTKSLGPATRRRGGWENL